MSEANNEGHERILVTRGGRVGDETGTGRQHELTGAGRSAAGRWGVWSPRRRALCTGVYPSHHSSGRNLCQELWEF